MAKRCSSYYDNYWPSYAPSRPYQVEDGIKAKSQRGKFVKNWWASRWIQALAQLMDSGRLSRGRSYARRGQVIEINVKPGHIMARVQGSQRTPYRVSIDLNPLSDDQWDRVFDELAEQAIFAAQLLNSEMPLDIEQVFETIDIPLFPATRGDIETDCSCPDWANPCKHIAAVYYLLGERFDEDPFLLFELRGRDKEAVIAGLRERRTPPVETSDGVRVGAPVVEVVDTVTLSECLDCYWALGAAVEDMALRLTTPAVDMAFVKRLGVPDFGGIDRKSFWAQMERVYAGVTERALDLAFADTE